MDDRDIGNHLLQLARAVGAQVQEYEPRIKWTSGILSVEPDLPEDKDWTMDNPFTSEIRRELGFIWLNRQEKFTAALEYYSAQLGKKGLRDWRCALAKMRFLEAIAFMGGLALRDPDWRPHQFSRAEKDRLVCHANEMLSYLRRGAILSDIGKQHDLENLIANCVTEVTDSTSRSYSGETAGQEAVLILLARSLRRLHLRNYEITNLIDMSAPLFGLNPSHRTVQRYVSKSKTDNA